MANWRTGAWAQPALLTAAISTQSVAQGISVEAETDSGHCRFLDSPSQLNKYIRSEYVLRRCEEQAELIGWDLPIQYTTIWSPVYQKSLVQGESNKRMWQMAEKLREPLSKKAPATLALCGSLFLFLGHLCQEL